MTTTSSSLQPIQTELSLPGTVLAKDSSKSNIGQNTDNLKPQESSQAEAPPPSGHTKSSLQVGTGAGESKDSSKRSDEPLAASDSKPADAGPAPETIGKPAVSKKPPKKARKSSEPGLPESRHEKQSSANHLNPMTEGEGGRVMATEQPPTTTTRSIASDGAAPNQPPGQIVPDATNRLPTADPANGTQPPSPPISGKVAIPAVSKHQRRKASREEKGLVEFKADVPKDIYDMIAAEALERHVSMAVVARERFRAIYPKAQCRRTTRTVADAKGNSGKEEGK